MRWPPSLDLPAANPETGRPMHLNPVCKSERKLGASTASALGLRASQVYLKICAEDHKLARFVLSGLCGASSSEPAIESTSAENATVSTAFDTALKLTMLCIQCSCARRVS